MELSVTQLILIGLIATVLSQGIKYVSALCNLKLGKGIVSIIALIFAVALAYIWLAPQLVIPADPMEAASYLLNQAGAVLGFATLIYNVLLQKLLEKLNAESDRLLPNLNFKMIG